MEKKSKLELLRPMGPQIGKTTLSAELVEYLNFNMNSSLADYSGALVGKVSQELQFSREIMERVLGEISERVAAYHLAHQPQDNDGTDLSIDIVSGWYVRQFNGEYNPLHVHSSGTMSCVGYLSLPDNFEQEIEEDGQDHHPANGMIEFAYCSANLPYTKPTFKVTPVVGEFYIFPASLWHVVYPFNTPGERRSFSMNMRVRKALK